MRAEKKGRKCVNAVKQAVKATKRMANEKWTGPKEAFGFERRDAG
jgi:hypothetical protein